MARPKLAPNRARDREVCGWRSTRRPARAGSIRHRHLGRAGDVHRVGGGRRRRGRTLGRLQRFPASRRPGATLGRPPYTYRGAAQTGLARTGNVSRPHPAARGSLSRPVRQGRPRNHADLARLRLVGGLHEQVQGRAGRGRPLRRRLPDGVLTAYCAIDEVAHIELNGHILIPLQNIASLPARAAATRRNRTGRRAGSPTTSGVAPCARRWRPRGTR